MVVGNKKLAMMRNAGTTCFILVISLALTACERKWYLDIIDATDLEYPVLCLSMKPKCTGDAVDVSILVFDEIDESGKTVRPAWIIQTVSNNPLKIVKFGTTPIGWTLVKSAIRLEPAKFYRVEGQVFTCRADKPNNVCTVMP